ncbi:MFS transporter [Catellatospora tritici]|uniref:MFS transporter n=1 Tax=Catellatospora tritici TaxID=2851566 RepID=UPI001C2CEA77|nr:MFS transporter [Catellatospora tritici]MBV1855572.1 MFS transporter [Catellatospora tritici]
MGQRTVISLHYLLTGVLTALWGATLPANDARLGLGPGRIGAVLLLLGVCGVVAMPVAGRLAGRWTERRMLRTAAPLCAAALAGPGLSGTYPLLMASVVLLGLCLGALNVMLSVYAVAVERRAGRPIMSTLYGVWTLGAVGGGAATSLLLWSGTDVSPLLVAAATLLAVLFVAVGRRLGPAHAAAVGSDAPRAAGGAGTGMIVLLGVVGAAAFITEGAATDWAGLHASRVLGADPGTASLVYTAFFAAMTVARLAGDAVRARMAAPALLRRAALVTLGGYALVLASPAADAARIGLAMAGWALTGVGMSVVWPVVSAAAGAAGLADARQLSLVTTIAYTGGLIGPAVIGAFAAATSLPLALLIPALLVLVVAGSAPLLAPALSPQVAA